MLAGGQGELAGKIVRFGTMGDMSEDDLRRRARRVEREVRSYKWCRLKYGITNGRANHGIVESIASSIGAS